MFVNTAIPHASIKPLNFVLWFLLAFEAGAINVGGFLTCKRFVTHVTGFATHIGVDIASGSLLSALSMAMVPVFFLLGCMASALLIDRRKYLGKNPYYTGTFLCSGMIFFSITGAGQMGWLGRFSETMDAQLLFVLLTLLSFLSGVQNSMIGFASGLLVRTTHLTGITTDLGVGLMRVLYPNLPSDQKSYELKMNVLRVGTIVSYIFGSIAGGFAFIHFHYIGFLIPTMISLFLAFYSWKFHQHQSSKPQSNELKVAA